MSVKEKKKKKLARARLPDVPPVPFVRFTLTANEGVSSAFAACVLGALSADCWRDGERSFDGRRKVGLASELMRQCTKRGRKV